MEKYETERFVLYSDLPRAEVDQWLRQFDTMYADLAAAFGMPADTCIWRSKSLFLLFKKREDYARAVKQFCGKVVGKKEPAVHIRRWNGDSEILATTEPVPKNPTTLAHILYHELGHAYLARCKGRAPNVPNWLDEGVAELIALRYGQSDRAKYDTNCRKTLRKDRSLEPLFACTTKPIDGPHYPVAGSLHQMLYDCDSARYWAFIAWIKYRADFDTALARSYGITRNELADAFGKRFGVEMKPPSKIELKLEPDVRGKAGPVPIRVHPRTKRAFVKATVNGVEGEFLLDTGLSDTILSPEFAKKAGLGDAEIRMPITAGNMGELGSFVSFARAKELTLGGMRFRNFHVILKTPLNKAYEFDNVTDGTIGANVLFARPLTLDLRNQRMTYAVPPPGKDSFELPLVRRVIKDGTPDITASINADVDGIPVFVMFDSGAFLGPSLMLINEPYHEAARKLADTPKADRLVVKSIRASGRELAANAEARILPFARSVLGSNFFDRYTITVDTAAGKVRLEPHTPAR